MAVHTTEPTQRRRRPWFELREARQQAGFHTYTSLADATPFSKSYLRQLEVGDRRPTPRVVATLAAILGTKPAAITPRPMSERPDDVTRMLHALPRGVRAQIPLQRAGASFGDCQWCDSPTGIGDARVAITWDTPDATSSGHIEVCPACMFAAVDSAITETDDEVTVEYTLVASCEALPDAA